jgi:phosphatidylserine decarboxylase
MATGVTAAWREVKGIVLALAGASLLAWFIKLRGLALLLASLLGWVFFFFRDPDRLPPSSAEEWILAPADGKVTDIELIDEPYFFNGPARRISVFLSIFDVHVQRSPYQGLVELLRYQPGSFAPAFLKDTHTNESNFIGLSTPRGPVAVKQIAGILARRIVCWPQPGDGLARGQRLGLIKFGSRVDLLLPPEVELLVQVGQQLYGGQTIVARWPSAPKDLPSKSEHTLQTI